jgi:hypothetical protein
LLILDQTHGFQANAADAEAKARAISDRRLEALLAQVHAPLLANCESFGQGGTIDTPARSEKDAKLAQKLGQPLPFIAIFPQECMGQLASFGAT